MNIHSVKLQVKHISLICLHAIELIELLAAEIREKENSKKLMPLWSPRKSFRSKLTSLIPRAKSFSFATKTTPIEEAKVDKWLDEMEKRTTNELSKLIDETNIPNEEDEEDKVDDDDIVMESELIFIGGPCDDEEDEDEKNENNERSKSPNLDDNCILDNSYYQPAPISRLNIGLDLEPVVVEEIDSFDRFDNLVEEIERELDDNKSEPESSDERRLDNVESPKNNCSCSIQCHCDCHKLSNSIINTNSESNSTRSISRVRQGSPTPLEWDDLNVDPTFLYDDDKSPSKSLN